MSVKYLRTNLALAITNIALHLTFGNFSNFTISYNQELFGVFFSPIDDKVFMICTFQNNKNSFFPSRSYITKQNNSKVLHSFRLLTAHNSNKMCPD